MAGADGLQAASLRAYSGRRGLVVVLGDFIIAGGQDAAVVDAGSEDSDAATPPFLQRGQGRLFQQGVATGQQDAIEAGIAGEIQRHLPLIYADAHRAYHPWLRSSSSTGQAWRSASSYLSSQSAS